MGDVDALATILREVLPDRGRLKTLGEAAQKRMRKWSPSQGIDSIVESIECAIRLR
jgi:hypothetical protein